MKRTLVWRGILLAGALLAVLVVQGLLIRNGLADHEALVIKRLQRTVAGFLVKAHRANDDLAMTEIVQQFAKSPAIVFAAVLDPEEKVIAHSDPGEMGKPFRGSRHRNLYRFLLRDSSKEWGELVFVAPDRAGRDLSRRSWMVGATVALIVWFLIAAYVYRLDHIEGQLRAEGQELRKLADYERGRANAALAREASAAQEWSSRLQDAVSRLPQTVAVLDPQQRLLAATPAALRRMGIPSAVLGKSWQQIPALQTLGPALERSLLHPRQRILCGNDQAPQLVLETAHPPLGVTWIEWLDTPALV